MENFSHSPLTKPLTNRPNLSWSGIFAGVSIAVAISWLFNLLGLGIGFASLSIAGDQALNTLSSVSKMSIIWASISAILSLFIGGWATTRLSGIDSILIGALHGLLNWALVTVLWFLLVIMATGAAVSSTMDLMKEGVSLAAKGAAHAVTELADSPISIADFNHLLGQVNDQVAQMGSQPSGDAEEGAAQSTESSTAETPPHQLARHKKDLQRAVVTFLKTENSAQENPQAIEDAKRQVVDLLVQQGDMDRQQAEQLVDDWQHTYQSIKEKAKQQTEEMKQTAIAAAKQTSQALAKTSLTTFFILLISAIAAASGGALGTKRNPAINTRPIETT